jgi:diaminopropionate ammonia-lyase
MIELAKGRKQAAFRPRVFLRGEAGESLRLSQTVPGYRPTPLHSLEIEGIGRVYAKDESKRFGLNAFKALGSLYAVAKWLARDMPMPERALHVGDIKAELAKRGSQKPIFATASDGNHGKGLAFSASLFGCESRVFLPRHAVQARVDAIHAIEGAKAWRSGGIYTETVELARRQAEENGWILVQDTSWPGYEEIPLWVMQGYGALAEEAASQLSMAGAAPTHVFLQAGVGSFAASMLEAFSLLWPKNRPAFVVVEPSEADCFWLSNKAGEATSSMGGGKTEMAGLDCESPSLLAWPVLRDGADFYLRCEDEACEMGMRRLAERGIVSGESGAVCYGALEMMGSMPEFRDLAKELGLSPSSRSLVISTEGDTDPENYRRIVAGGGKQ